MKTGVWLHGDSLSKEGPALRRRGVGFFSQHFPRVNGES